MLGAPYCLLCGADLRGGRSDRRYCGANCRTRASRMRKRGEPVRPSAAPQSVLLASLLTEGLSCPCCGVRIMLHTTVLQAGAPTGHTVPASQHGHAPPDTRPARVKAPRSPGNRPIRPGSSRATRTPPRHGLQAPLSVQPFTVPVAPGPPTAQTIRHAHMTPSDPDAVAAAPMQLGQRWGVPLASVTPKLQQTEEPSARLSVQRPLHPPAPLDQQPHLAGTQASSPLVTKSLPPGLFPIQKPIVSYGVLVQQQATIVAACRSTRLLGKSWPESDESLERFVREEIERLRDVFSASRPDAEQAQISDWFECQAGTLCLAGILATKAAQAIWDPMQIANAPYDFTDRVVKGVMSALEVAYPDDTDRTVNWFFDHWYLLSAIVDVAVGTLGCADQAQLIAYQQSQTERDAAEGNGVDDEHESDDELTDSERDEQTDDGEESDDEVEDSEDDV